MDDINKINIGIKVVVSKLEDEKGMMIKQYLLNNRRLGAKGRVLDYVPGHGGDVWWVKHESGVVAPYCFTELELDNG